jgi:hypothetical protein
MTSEDEVRYERVGAAAVVTIDRPHRRNAIDGATADRLERAFETFEADADARVMVLTGEGGIAFCAGADLTAIESLGPRLTARAARRASPVARLRSRRSPPSTAGASRAGSSWRCGVTCACAPLSRASVASSVAGASRWSTAAPSGCRGSSGSVVRSI